MRGCRVPPFKLLASCPDLPTLCTCVPQSGSLPPQTLLCAWPHLAPSPDSPMCMAPPSSFPPQTLLHAQQRDGHTAPPPSPPCCSVMPHCPPSLTSLLQAGRGGGCCPNRRQPAGRRAGQPRSAEAMAPPGSEHTGRCEQVTGRQQHLASPSHTITSSASLTWPLPHTHMHAPPPHIIIITDLASPSHTHTCTHTITSSSSLTWPLPHIIIITDLRVVSHV